MILSLFWIPINAIMFRIRGNGDINGDGISDVKRWMWFVYLVPFCYFASPDVVSATCYLWVHIVLGTFPTQALFTAIHGNLPQRKDSVWFQWMQDACSGIIGKLYGVDYGVWRSLATIPAIIVLESHGHNFHGVYLWVLCTTHGAIYYLWGTICQKDAVQNSELTIGATIAAIMAI